MSVCAFVCIISFAAAINPVKTQEFTKRYYADNTADLVPVRTIYEPDASGRSLVPYLKCFFTYDKEGRVIIRETHRWNKLSQSWKPAFTLQVMYEDSSVTIDYVRWNSKEKKYTLRKEKFICQLDGDEIVSFAHYKQNSKSEEWNLVTTISDLRMNLSQIFDGFLKVNEK